MFKVAIHSRHFEPENLVYYQILLNELTAVRAEIRVSEAAYLCLKLYNQDLSYLHAYSTHTQIIGSQFLLSMGGDGTILEAITYVRDKGIPILGINTGRLGFLATISKEKIPTGM